MKGQPDIMIMNYHKIIPDFVLNLKPNYYYYYLL